MAATTERAILAGGCFWGMQQLVRRLPGVVSTRVGYSGGDVKNATYRNHGTHAEAIEITFDPSQTSFRDLLEFFFQIHDPTTPNRQGNDRGTSYRSAIFYTSEEQRRVAEHTPLPMLPCHEWRAPAFAKPQLSRAPRRRKKNVRGNRSSPLTNTPPYKQRQSIIKSSARCLLARWLRLQTAYRVTTAYQGRLGAK